MRIYDIVFYLIAFFLIGVFMETSGLDIAVIIFSTFFLASLFLFAGYLDLPRNFSRQKLFIVAGLSLAVVFGGFYSLSYSAYKKNSLDIAFNEKNSFQAVVSDYPKRGEYQDLILSLESPYSGNILAKLPLHPEFNYGDLISLEGTIKKIGEGSYADYLNKEGIAGTIDFPKAEILSKNQASKFKFVLFSFKDRIIYSFEKNLPFEEANLLGGLTLGEQAGFSDQMKQEMRNSGTTHLVALSGYNISILVTSVMIFLGYFLKRRYAFFAVILVIAAFVLATGAEASVVRAAIMGGILLLAGETGRIYSLRNAIASTAFFMVLFNPRILRFDIGFQLSFLALLGIIYLAPALKNIFKAKDGLGVLGWRENFWTTLSAQAAVFPLLIFNFSGFSPLSLVSNVLVLGFIPLTMGFGFVLGFFDLIFKNLSFILSWLVHIFLFYEVSVIKFFGSRGIFMVSSINALLVPVYYVILLLIIFHGRGQNWGVLNFFRLRRKIKNNA